MSTPQWEPGHLYQPGDIVVPRSLSSTAQVPPDDPGFESGALGDWSETAVGGAASGAVSSTYHFEGTKSYLWAGGAGSGQGGGIGVDLVNDFRAPVVPGQSIAATCYCMSVPLHREHDVHSHVRIYWYNSSNVLLSYTDSTSYGGAGNQFGTTGAWVASTITGVAPAGAAFASIGAFLTSDQGDANGAYVDGFSWNYVASTLPDGLVFRAVQAASGFSDASEPVWPVVDGATVVDNEVTWEAVFASRVVWEATPVLKSGSVEPTFPTVPGGTVVDDPTSPSAIVWVAMDNRVKDEKCPNTKEVLIASSKVYAADVDIIGFSATVNPLDWSTLGDAGYLPFGLQAYGATPVSALGLYRSNLIGANSKGYQMWQVDEDPANMALLDASPVDCPYHKSMQPVSNDLVFLTSQGIRSIGIAGASTNLQAGFFGKQIDPLVKAKILELADGEEPRGLFYPGAGQYWLFFGAEAFILTMNGGPDDMSWSRYVLPSAIDDWTIHNAKLYLRSGQLVWEVSEEAECCDDIHGEVLPPTLAISSVVGTTINLIWTAAVSDQTVVGYRLYDALTDELIIDQPGLTYAFLDIVPGDLYSFYVIAYDVGGQSSDPSNIVAYGPVAAPVLTLESADVTSIELSWTEPLSGNPITGYKLYDASDDSLIVDQAGRTYSLPSPTPATLYSFYVTAHTSGEESDPSNTVEATVFPLLALLHFDGTDGSTTITDEAGIATWTARDAVVTPQASLDTGVEKFGTSSLFLHSPSGWASGSARSDIISNSQASFNPGLGDWTLQMFCKLEWGVNLGGFPTPYLWQLGKALSDRIYVYQPSVQGNFKLAVVQGSNPPVELNSGIAGTEGAWHHVAVVRHGTDIQIFIDGVLGGELTNPTLFSGACTLCIGTHQFFDLGADTLRFRGWVDEVYFVQGAMYWDSNFTPPTVAFSPP